MKLKTNFKNITVMLCARISIDVYFTYNYLVIGESCSSTGGLSPSLSSAPS